MHEAQSKLPGLDAIVRCLLSLNRQMGFQHACRADESRHKAQSKQQTTFKGTCEITLDILKSE